MSVTEAVEPLTDLIGRAESDNVGGYNAANAGQAMDLGTNGLQKHFGRPASEVTVGEVLLAQELGRLHAVGRYQVIGSTMRELVERRCISGADTLDKVTQDRLAVCLMRYKRPRIWHYITTGKGLQGAANSLALEWASFPWADGRTYYPSGNAVKVTRGQVVNALKLARRNAVESPELFK